MILPDGYSDVPAGKLAAVVTHLEMLTPPVLAPEPSRAWTIRRVVEPDLDWYRDLYSRVGADWIWSSRLRMDDAALAAAIHVDGIEVYALMHDGHAEALLELDFRKPANCEIVFFGVTETLIGRGAARALMDHALRHAWSKPVSRVWLHTCTFDSPRALGFYQRAGFRPFSRQVEVIDDPRRDGTLPRNVGGHVPLIE